MNQHLADALVAVGAAVLLLVSHLLRTLVSRLQDNARARKMNGKQTLLLRHLAGYGTVLTFAGEVSVTEEDKLYDNLMAHVAAIKLMPYASRVLIVDLTETDHLNQTGAFEIMRVVRHIAAENGLKMKVLVPRGKAWADYHRSLGEIADGSNWIEVERA